MLKNAIKFVDSLAEGKKWKGTELEKAAKLNIAHHMPKSVISFPLFFSPSVWSSFFFFTKQKLTIVHSLKSWMKKNKKHAGWTIGTNAFSFWLWWISDNVQTPILFSTFRHDRCFVLHLQRMKSLLKKKSLPSWPDPVPDRGCWPWTAGSASASGSRSDGSWVFRARPHQGKQQAGYYLLKGEVRRWA